MVLQNAYTATTNATCYITSMFSLKVCRKSWMVTALVCRRPITEQNPQ